MVGRSVVPLTALGVVAGALVSRDLGAGSQAIPLVQGAILILERCVHVGLLDVIQELGEGRVLRDPAEHRRLGPGTGKLPVRSVVIVHRYPDLLLVVRAVNAARRLARRLNRRQQHCEQDADDGNHH